jgi:hypothetical protein
MTQLNTLLVSMTVLVATSLPAHAYLDPGTGSLIVQSLIGGFLAASTFATIYIGKIVKLFRRVTGKVGPEGKGPSE